MTASAQDRPHYQATFFVLMVSAASYALLQSEQHLVHNAELALVAAGTLVEEF